ncbi:MAG: septum formation initiator family protein [Clostridiales bacterium]|nr:septum formation initiator family protein [Clostridiales bacterium]
MKKKTQLIIKIALAVFSVFLLVSVVVLKIQVDELEKQKNELTAVAEKNKEELEELKYKLTLSEIEYIERYAREELGYHKTGEIVFINQSED